MLDIVLRILPILGVIFLILLALAAAFVLLALFFPVSYRIAACRDTDTFQAAVRLRWLFGLLRVGYRYPEPGRIRVKALFFTLYNGKFPGGKEERAGKEAVAETSSAKNHGRGKKNARAGKNPVGQIEKEETPAGDASPPEDVPVEKEDPKPDVPENAEGEAPGPAAEGTGNTGGFFQKIEKIKYTILRICDKIKGIWENISYYAGLLREEDTKRLFADVLFRAGKILKCIRPRHIKADILFGTGSPDTTGYMYGLYCMLASVLCYDRMWVTPDFENAVLKGRIEIKGHVTLWVLLINGWKIFTDKRLKELIEKGKAGKIKKE